MDAFENIRLEASKKISDMGSIYIKILEEYFREKDEVRKSALLEKAEKIRPHLDTLMNLINIP